MPTYEYACTQCGYKFEQFQSIVSEPARECPKCTGRLQRLINGGAGLIFKGSGFYLTDYKRPSPPQAGGDARDGGESQKAENAEGKKEPGQTEKAGNAS